MEKEMELKVAERIKNQYVEKPASKLEQLRQLDKKVKRNGAIFAYLFGVIGTLTLGVGMCLAMKVFGGIMSPTLSMGIGVVVGLGGIAMMVANYYIFKIVDKKNKKKYESEILELSDKILNEGK